MSWILTALLMVVAAYCLVLLFGSIGFFVLRFFVRCSVRSEHSACSNLELYLSIFALVLAIGGAFVLSN